MQIRRDALWRRERALHVSWSPHPGPSPWSPPPSLHHSTILLIRPKGLIMRLGKNSLGWHSRVSDPHNFLPDQDPDFHFNADPSDPAPHQGNANLRTLAYRPSRPSFWATTPPFWASPALHGSILSLDSSRVLTLMRIQIQLSFLMRIRI